MRKISHLSRLTLLAGLALVVLIPAGLLLGLPRGAGVHTNAAADVVKSGGGFDYKPWFGLRTLNAPVDFHERATPPTSAPPPIKAESGILVDIDSGTILWDRNPHESLPPASTTKTLTALVALENFPTDKTIRITPQALQQEWDETRMGMVAGEIYTVREMLYGMLLVSANDVATAFAVDTVGMERFVATMNAQVKALGLKDSHFVTPVGLDDPQQYASAYDLAAIGMTDYNNFPLFRQVVGTVDYTLPQTPLHNAYQLHNLNQLLQLYPAAVGIKPGWTGNAGACLVGMAIRNGHRLIAVLMNAAYPAAEESHLLDWGFTQEGLAPLLPPATPQP